jgi:hypothetical protein
MSSGRVTVRLELTPKHTVAWARWWRPAGDVDDVVSGECSWTVQD